MKVLKSHKCFEGLTSFCEHDSKFTKTKMKFAIHEPPKDKKVVGGVIWLSGLTCNEENFIVKAGSQRILSELGLVIICPDTSPRGLNLKNEHKSFDFGSGASLYVDATTEGYKDHYRMYSYVNEEIYNLLDISYDLKQNISLMGHSMGGHGALTIGLKNPKKYKSISAFAPLVNPVRSQGWAKEALIGYLGNNPELWRSYDATELVSNGNLHPNKILIDQGLSDEFYPGLLTQNFAKACKSSGQNLELNLRKNYDHSYYFVSTFIQSHLKFHHSYLR